MKMKQGLSTTRLAMALFLVELAKHVVATTSLDALHEVTGDPNHIVMLMAIAILYVFRRDLRPRSP